LSKKSRSDCTRFDGGRKRSKSEREENRGEEGGKEEEGGGKNWHCQAEPLKRKEGGAGLLVGKRKLCYFGLSLRGR